MTTPGTTVQITGHVYELRFSYDTKSSFVMFNSDKMADDHYTYVGPISVAYTVPADYNSTAQKLAALVAKREAACKQFAETVRAIDERISKLQAITFDGVAA